MTASTLSRTVVLGVPIIPNDLANAGRRSPMGQVELYQQVRRQIKNQPQFHRAICQEYLNIFYHLRKMQIPFLVLEAHRHYIADGIRQAMQEIGVRFLPFPDIDLELMGYPRDMMVQLPNGVVLLDYNASELGEALQALDIPFVISPLGQGGRMHLRGNIALVPETLWLESTKSLPTQDHLPVLHEAGLKVGILPNTMVVESGQGVTGYLPDDHVDRTSGLVEGQDGDLHLLLPQNTRSGYRGLLAPPRYTSKETLAVYQRVCEPLGITVHVLQNMQQPAATNFQQFSDGRVLITKGDPELSSLMTTLVGKGKVYHTDTPIQYYPVYWHGGIRCLIGEFPTALCQYFLEHPPS